MINSLPRSILYRICLAALLALASYRFTLAQSRAGNDHWVGTWATAVVQRPQPPRPASSQQATQTSPTQAPQAQQNAPQAALSLSNQTLREIVHVSLGGNRVRAALTNEFGTAPLVIGAASIALRDKEAKIVPSSRRALTFSGQFWVTIPPGAIVLSDAVDEAVPAMADLAIDVYLPADMTAESSSFTGHAGAFQTNYVSTEGNFAGSPEMPVLTTTQSWYFLTRVEVRAPQQVGAVVAFGDSITDGSRSTPNTNGRWPDQLARRLNAVKDAKAGSNSKAGNDAKTGDRPQQHSGSLAILNAAIAGNRLLSDSNLNVGVNALARFDRDVLAQSGVSFVIIMEGINDIGNAHENPTPTAADVIAAQRQLIERAHAHGLKVFGATLTPFEGAAYFTPEGEAKRQAVNQWIRTSQAYDAVIDFDAVVRDPASPAKILARFDSGDHLHPNDSGYEAMGNAVDLKLFGHQSERRSLKSRRLENAPSHASERWRIGQFNRSDFHEVSWAEGPKGQSLKTANSALPDFRRFHFLAIQF